VAVRQGVAAHVDQHDQVGLHGVGRLGKPSRDPLGPRVRIPPAAPALQEARHVRLGEHDLSPACVSGPAASTQADSRLPPSMSSIRRRPGRGSITRRSQVTPPTSGAAPW
jgi:hypothetical protein